MSKPHPISLCLKKKVVQECRGQSCCGPAGTANLPNICWESNDLQRLRGPTGDAVAAFVLGCIEGLIRTPEQCFGRVVGEA